MRKIDNALKVTWFMFLPMSTMLIIITAAIVLFIKNNDERGAMLINVVCALAVIYLSGWTINLIWTGIKSLVDRRKRRL